MSEFIMVPVPEERVTEVYALLGQASVSDAAPTQDGEQRLSAEWSDAEIQRCYRESSDKMKLVLEFLAKNPNQPIHSDKLYAEIEYSAHQFAGAMGAFGRRVKNRYSKAVWFFEARWDPEAGMAVYNMPDDVASIISAMA